LFNIFTTVNNKSEVHDRVCTAESNIDKIFKEIAQLKKDDKNLKTHIDKEMAITRLDIQDYKAETANTCEDFNTRIDANKAELDKHEERLGKINSETKMMKAFEENL